MANAFQAIMDQAGKPAPSDKPKRVSRAPKAVEAKQATSPVIEAAEPVEARSKSYRPVREGKRFVGAHFPPEVARQLKMLAAEDETTVQELLEQAVDLLFVKHGKAKAADLGKK